MSVCLETSTVLTTSVGTTTSLSSDTSTSSSAFHSADQTHDVLDQTAVSQKNIAKLVLANSLPSVSSNSAPLLQKVPSSSVITVVNATGPLTIVKTLCTSSSTQAAPHFTLVSSTPLNVTNAVGKPITLVGAPPITVLRSITNATSAVAQITTELTKTTDTSTGSACNVSTVNGSMPVSTERPAVHNVFVKNTTAPPDLVPGSVEISQSQKLLTVTSFSQNTLLQSTCTNPVMKTANGQKPITTNSKLKILSNVVPATSGTPGPSAAGNTNIVLNKSVSQKFYPTHQKVLGNANGTPKYLNKLPNNTLNKANTKILSTHKTQKLLFPTHKNQIKTIPPANNYLHRPPGIKTLSPQSRGISSQQVHRTSSGLRTIPPQRPSKLANKPNYIGKHAVQAQKLKGVHGANKSKGIKQTSSGVNNTFTSRVTQNSPVTFNQALTAQILETLGQNSSVGGYVLNKGSDTTCYTNSYTYMDNRHPLCMDSQIVTRPVEHKLHSNLDTLSLICQAVLLDHNYNATLPTEAPQRSTSVLSVAPQINGTNIPILHSPGSNTRCKASLASTNTLSTLSSASSSTLIGLNSTSTLVQDDDAASDISCGSERKPGTEEGEETDTAPEAEAVNNDCYDHYGDYVTRCICGYLHDDGYMIECDRCKVWQHVRCVVRTKKVPEDYLCEVCDSSKPVDRARARTLQQQWMRDIQDRDARIRKEAKLKEIKLKETLSDSDTSDSEHLSNNVMTKNRASLASRRKSESCAQKQNAVRQRKDSGRETTNRRTLKRKERKIPKRKNKPPPKSQSDDESQDTWTQSSVAQLPQLRQWIENYEEAVTNHYSPELRARISSIRVNGAHSDLLTQADSSVHKCRVHTQPLTGIKYLVSTMHLPPNTAVVELRGKYMLSTQHRTAPHGGTLTTRQHAQRPGPFLFFYRLHKDNTEVCVDTRTYGNDARFVRRSCKPNAELRHCMEKGVLHLYVVTVATIEKNMELTIKHESHDLAAVGTTHIACACGKFDGCTVNKEAIVPVKKNGESTDLSGHRKRRGRRTVSVATDHETLKTKDDHPPSPVEVKPDIPEVMEEPEIKTEEVVHKVEEKVVVEASPVKNEVAEEPVTPEKLKVEVTEEDSGESSPSHPPVTRKSVQSSRSEVEEKRETSMKDSSASESCKKLSREERKLEAIMKAFERLERMQQRKQEHQAKQAHRRESEPSPACKEKEREDDKAEPKIKRRRRKGRARTVSTNAQTRRNRLNSADSSYATSGDEALLSPSDSLSQNSLTSKDTLVVNEQANLRGSSLLLALANGEDRNDAKSPPPRDMDCNSNSAHSSPETPLSSACLLVAAAVEPLEPGFKFPKTKKGLMNEWLNKGPECVQSASSISPSSLTPHIVPPAENSFYDSNSNSGFYGTGKSLVALAQAANYCDSGSQSHGNAKKRWLRQAISEDQCDSPNSRPESPPVSEMVAPPKKRRLPRESLSTDITPPTTPTSTNAPAITTNNEDLKTAQEQDSRVEIIYSVTDGDSPTQVLESDAVLKERAAEMQQEFGSCVRLSEPHDPSQAEMPPLRCSLDPRLSRSVFNNSEHLVGTVEKTLSILGLEEHKPEIITPAKRKLSITEYRQRKKLTVNEKTLGDMPAEENNSSQSPLQNLRPRSDSASSATSFMSSDDEIHPAELPEKALSAFNSEPTELEKQRENVGLRLKKAFGLSVEEDSLKAALKVKTLLNCELPLSVNTTLPLTSPTCTVPGNGEPSQPATVEAASQLPVKTKSLSEEELPAVENRRVGPHSKMEVKPEMFYTPDDEEKIEEAIETNREVEKYMEVESTSYVPPFNNPLYPNSSFTSYGSVIDDNAPYEGRNPSPPPELSVNAPSSYSVP